MRFEPDLAIKSERKTRSKRLREINNDQLDAIVPKSKKRKNYVSYPTDDDHVGEAELNDAKNTEKTLRNTLKEQNINIQSTETEDIILDARKPNRITRQTRKLAENHPEDVFIEQEITEVPNKKGKKKSKNKKRRHTESVNDNDTEPVVTKETPIKAETLKKRSNSIVKGSKKDTNKTEISADSFYSAAGSPLKENIEEPVISIGKSSENQKLNTTFEIEDAIESMSTAFEKDTKSGNKLSIKNSTFDIIRTPGKLQNSISNKVCSKNIEKTNKLNTDFDTGPRTRRSLHNINIMDSIKTDVIDTKQSGVFEKTMGSTTISMESTCDQETKLNSTYNLNETTSPKSSLVSFDSTLNVTFDKPDNSRISITRDDSKTEIITNTTPIMIESSMDDSKHLEQFNISNKTKTPDKSIQEGLPLLTPLKREGTFTKEGPEITIISQEPKVSLERTPTKKTSLPSPGFTPYRVSQTSQKEKKSLLNVTRSLEKPTRRSSLAELVPRHTRVMFCSSVNNPGVMTQQKKKIIKSSLKGSNKSFVFEENGKCCSPFIQLFNSSVM